MIAKKYAASPLNDQASVLVDAQTDIKLTIKNGVLNGAPFVVIKKKLMDVIETAIARIRSPTLKANARVSLIEFANRAYNRLNRVFVSPAQAVAVYTLIKSVYLTGLDGKEEQTIVPKTQAEKTAIKSLYGNSYRTTAKGIPLQEFQKNYMSKVKMALSDLSDMNAIDSDDITGRNSLRNFAEMQVRYEAHENNLKVLKENGTKLVVCSVHGDCSERCSKWQGRVYSLDGTTGITDDGKKYVPIEQAINVYYTTKAGKTYRNGLLGFNCRHKLYPYTEGMVIPTVSKKEQQVERAITRRQRELERRVIYWREQALMSKNVNADYKKARANAIYWNKRYKQFSKEHGRAYYPDRVRVL